MTMKAHLHLWTCALLATSSLHAENAIRSGLVDTAFASNQALIVGAPNGLPGIDTDLANATAIATNPAYNFQTTSLYDDQATKSAMLSNLQSLAGSVEGDGTFFFYFSGHGNKGIIAATNFEIVSIQEIRNAIQAGRQSNGPLSRLVLIFDSCNAGSLLNSLGVLSAPLARLAPPVTSDNFADSVVDAFAPRGKAASYWQKLFVFASSTADETSEAGDQGSLFTEAMRKAFDEVSATGTVNDFITKTQSYTGSAQHPVARLVPTTWSSEKLRD